MNYSGKEEVWDHFGKKVGVLASATSVLGLGGVLISLLANAVIFSLWGLNFFDIAVPSDILMSGANALVKFSLVILIVAILALFNRYYFKVFGGFIEKRRLPEKIAVVIADFTPIVAMIIAAIGFIAVTVYEDQWLEWLTEWARWLNAPEPDIDLANLPAVASAIYVTLILFGSVVIHILSSPPRSEILKRVRTFTLKSTTFVPLSLVYGLGVFVFVGLVEGPRLRVVSEIPDCAGEKLVAWSGAESLVISCGETRKFVSDMEDFRIVRRRNVTLAPWEPMP